MSTGALLTIISGTPGTGKSAMAVSIALEFLRENPDRPVFVGGIPELKLPHIPVPPVAEWTAIQPHPDDPSIEYPEFTFPDGALVILDEAQNFFRARGAGSPVPAHVAAMERHRHKGLDFILICQGPGMLDPNIRRLCGRYIHILDTWQGRFTFEWPECVDPLTSRGRAIKSRYKLPKEVFGLYKSSSKHVKRERRIPSMAWFGLAALAACVVLGYQAYHAITGKGEADAAPAAADSPASGIVIGESRNGTSAGPVGRSIQSADFIPRMPQRPETAPLYDPIRQVKSMPTVAGCVAMADRCKCYTSQATDAFLTDAECRAWIESPPFDPWRDPLPSQQQPTGQGVSRQDGPHPVGAAPSAGAGVS